MYPCKYSDFDILNYFFIYINNNLQVKSLAKDCQGLRNDALNVREELKLTQAQRDSIERDYNETCDDSGDLIIMFSRQ